MAERTLRFQKKLWQIVNSCRSGAVSWSLLGNSVIFKFQQFKREYLDGNAKFCKSNKLASFVRQLNLYGFRKLVKGKSGSRQKFQDVHEFQNIFFQRNREDLLHFVIRSSTTPTHAGTLRSKYQPQQSLLQRKQTFRGRKCRGRGRRIKHENILDVDEVDHCYGKVDEYLNPALPVVVKKEPFSPEENPAEKFSNMENKSGDEGTNILLKSEARKTPLSQKKPSNGQVSKDEAKMAEENPQPPAGNSKPKQKKENKENISLTKKRRSRKKKKGRETKKSLKNLDDRSSAANKDTDAQDVRDNIFHVELMLDDDLVRNYLQEPDMFEESSRPKLGGNGSNDGTEEYLELKEAFERMSFAKRPAFCACCYPIIKK